MSREATRFSIEMIFFEEKISNFRSIFQHKANAKYCQNHRTGKISFQIHIQNTHNAFCFRQLSPVLR